MRYKVGEIEICSENAARSAKQPSRHLVEWILKQSRVEHALDYGCGKLRYSAALTERCNHLTLVDSKIQVERIQTIGSDRTSVRAYVASSWHRARVLTIEEFESDQQRYDLSLCANVLSTIPVEEARSKALCLLLESLKQSGVCLFVSQYTNSYFKAVARSPGSIPHLDGYIVQGRHGYSYYGILPKHKLEALVTEHGFEVVDSWIAGQSAYVLASQPSS